MSLRAGLITAAGTSQRMGEPLKKEYRLLNGSPVLVHAIRPFLQLCGLGPIVVTVPPGDLEVARSLISAHLDMDRLHLVEGGGSRQLSVLLGLEALEPLHPDTVLIHDGARPWVTAELIQRVLEGAEAYEACIPVLEPFEAPKLIDSDGFIVEHLDRKSLGMAQTPQAFAFAGILEAHHQARDRLHLFLDDAAVYSFLGGRVAVVAGERGNRKITYREDLPQ